MTCSEKAIELIDKMHGNTEAECILNAITSVEQTIDMLENIEAYSGTTCGQLSFWNLVLNELKLKFANLL